MHTMFFYALIAAAGVASACGGTPVNPGNPGQERVAPPDTFIVTTAGGTRLAGAAARVDIRYSDAGREPEVEIAFSASADGGGSWATQSVAPSDFLKTLSLSAVVVSGPVARGQASVQLNRQEGSPSFASGGVLQLRIQGGRMAGETSGTSADFTARFEGPFVVTCAVPPASLATAAPASTSNDARLPLVVDEQFESALCQPYASLAGRSR